MGLISSAPLADRYVAIFQASLGAEIARIDTAENALSSVGQEGYFTTDAIPAAAITSMISAGDGYLQRVTVRTGGRSPREYQHGRGTSVRLDTAHQLSVEVRVSTSQLAQGYTGALRRAERITRACESLVVRFPEMQSPDSTPALAGIEGVFGTYGACAFADEYDQEHDIFLSAGLILPITVRVIRSR
jgi:hypothetical protein